VSLLAGDKYKSFVANKVLHLGKLRAIPTNIRLGCKGMQETNTLAYSENSSITNVNFFITLGPGYRRGSDRRHRGLASLPRRLGLLPQDRAGLQLIKHFFLCH
jgi:hypothetical protein